VFRGRSTEVRLHRDPVDEVLPVVEDRPPGLDLTEHIDRGTRGDPDRL
jgi:hypothetical protein